ncbi:M20 family metallopeptidase [Kordiimonas gwangyangensis]|nr:M20/M25/M40 family metallo-hydrolase [Kordiimonas gwangyangensis]
MVDHYAKLNNYIDRNSDYVTGLLQDMIRIPTVNPKFEVAPERNKEAEHQDFLEGELKSLGFLTEQSEPFENRPNLVGVWSGNEERSLLLGGHVDVVPEGNINKWTVDPYGGEIRDGRLFGRGALDMKGGLAACVMAVKAVKECGFELAGQVEIHAVVDEEAGGFGSRALANTRKVPAAGIITEPTWHSINPAEGGLVFMRVTIPGKNSHAAWRYNSIYPQHHVPDRPEPGVNAIELGTRFLAALRELEREWAMRKYHP